MDQMWHNFPLLYPNFAITATYNTHEDILKVLTAEKLAVLEPEILYMEVNFFCPACPVTGSSFACILCCILEAARADSSGIPLNLKAFDLGKQQEENPVVLFKI